MRRLILASVFVLAGCSIVAAQNTQPQITSSDKRCATITMTTASAYTAGNVVGGLLTIPGLTRVAPGPNALTAAIHSIDLKFQETHTEEFDISSFDSAPTTTFTDKSAPAISAADALNVQIPIKLATANTLLGANGTVYGQDAVGRVIRILDGVGRFVITTPGTPTFTAATAKLCVGVLQD